MTKHEDWISLTDYSSKYKVSISTLRRRIKTDQIRYSLMAGKYFLADAPPVENVQDPTLRFDVKSLHSGVHQLFQNKFASSAVGPKESAKKEAISENASSNNSAMKSESGVQDEQVLVTATKLLQELKKAYSSILHEKEEQILQLKEEVVDLKTLVRVLEEDNERLRGRMIAVRDHRDHSFESYQSE